MCSPRHTTHLCMRHVKRFGRPGDSAAGREPGADIGPGGADVHSHREPGLVGVELPGLSVQTRTCHHGLHLPGHALLAGAGAHQGPSGDHGCLVCGLPHNCLAEHVTRGAAQCPGLGGGGRLHLSQASRACAPGWWGPRRPDVADVMLANNGLRTRVFGHARIFGRANWGQQVPRGDP